jgi:hypothetical protein
MGAEGNQWLITVLKDCKKIWENFLAYQEIQKGLDVKSYLSKDFLIHDEMHELKEWS